MKRSTVLNLAGMAAGVIFLGAQLICTAQSAPTNLWTLQLPDFHTTSSPAIAPDGTIYQATFTGNLPGNLHRQAAGRHSAGTGKVGFSGRARSRVISGNCGRRDNLFRLA
jgi:outer membrane protein assembly factor BamB